MEQNQTHIHLRNMGELLEQYKGMTPEEIREARKIEGISWARQEVKRLQEQINSLSPKDEERREKLLKELKTTQEFLPEAESTQKE